MLSLASLWHLWLSNGFPWPGPGAANMACWSRNWRSTSALLQHRSVDYIFRVSKRNWGYIWNGIKELVKFKIKNLVPSFEYFKSIEFKKKIIECKSWPIGPSFHTKKGQFSRPFNQCHGGPCWNQLQNRRRNLAKRGRAVRRQIRKRVKMVCNRLAKSQKKSPKRGPSPRARAGSEGIIFLIVFVTQ